MFPAKAVACAACAVLSLGMARAMQTAASRFALVTVADPRGRAVVDVGPDDFVVQESGEPREILDVRVADYPIAVVIDNGETSRLKAVGRFVERLGPRPLAMVSAGSQPKVIASFEDERHALLTRLDSIHPSPGADVQPLGAATLAAQALVKMDTLFSALVVVTASPVERSGRSVEELIAPLVESRAIIHVVAHGATGAPIPVWRELVEQTRGEYTTIYSFSSYQPALDRLADRLTTELLIEYLVPVGSKASDPKVGIRVPGARVRGLGIAPR